MQACMLCKWIWQNVYKLLKCTVTLPSVIIPHINLSDHFLSSRFFVLFCVVRNKVFVFTLKFSFLLLLILFVLVLFFVSAVFVFVSVICFILFVCDFVLCWFSSDCHSKCLYLIKVNLPFLNKRQYRRSNQKWTIQRNCYYWVHKTKTTKTNDGICKTRKKLK